MRMFFMRIFLFSSIVLTLVATGAWCVTAHSEDNGPYINVGLQFGSTSVPAARLESPQGFYLMRIEGDVLVFVRSLEEYRLLNVERAGSHVVVSDADGVVLSNRLSEDSVLLAAPETDGESILFIDGKGYRGGARFRPAASGRLTVINYVSLEQYVAGVLSKEMSPSYPLEALKAQAVAARSFAVGDIDKHASHGFDLCTTTCCQVYAGVSAEYEQTNRACEETKGEVLVYDGDIAAAYYHASSGGYTENSEDVWMTKLPYLRSVRDEYAPLAPWHTNLSFADLKLRLERASYQPGDIRSIQVTRRLSNGSVAEVLIEGSREQILLTKEAVRIALGGSTIRSVRFSMGSSPVPPIYYSQSEGSGTLHGTGGTLPKSGTVAAMAAGSKTAEVPVESLYVWNGRASEKLQTGTGAGDDPVFTEETVTGGTVYFQGLGHGHGVGMPQTSAREMAKRGHGYRAILQYYYTGVDIAMADEWVRSRR